MQEYELARKAAIASDAAYVQRMMRAIKRGRESAAVGVFVDTSPTFARTLRGDPAVSGCGSPAQMCIERGSPNGGGDTLK